MICQNCGAELPEGIIYCPNCGCEIQVISAVDDLEEEILRELVDEEKGTSVPPADEPAAAPTRQDVKKPKKRRIWIWVLVIAVAALVIVLFAGVRFNRNHSEDYLLRQATQAYMQQDYEDALDSLDRLFALDADNEDALYLAGEVYAAMEDYDAAEQMYLRLIELDPDCADAYAQLLWIYDMQGRTEDILALRSAVTNEEILALFDDYVTPEPEISVAGGSFDDYFSVEIRAPKEGLSIYYTLDGQDPTRYGLLYASPIEIDQQGTVILTAVCLDQEGRFSEPVSETYQIELAVPDMPVANPDGGQFTTQQSVTVSVPAGTTVYYTWDGSTPTTNSNRYTGPIQIPEGNHILSLIAVNEKGISSDVLKCNYIYYPATTSQTISSSEGSFGESGGSTQDVPAEVPEQTGEEPDEPAESSESQGG